MQGIPSLIITIQHLVLMIVIMIIMKLIVQITINAAGGSRDVM